MFEGVRTYPGLKHRQNAVNHLFSAKLNSNFVQKIIFITLDLITSESNWEWEEFLMPILLPLPVNLICLGSYKPYFGAHLLACRVKEKYTTLNNS